MLIINGYFLRKRDSILEHGKSRKTGCHSSLFKLQIVDSRKIFTSSNYCIFLLETLNKFVTKMN